MPNDDMIRYSLGDDEQERWFDLPASQDLGVLFDKVSTTVKKVIALADAKIIPADAEQQQMMIAAKICKPLCEMFTIVWCYASVERETLQEQIAILKEKIDALEAAVEKKVH